ncbi:MAG TPA: VgrG-related protein [Fimbriimonadaceae bacterium]|nr:VgrG-related protein [Fimbriimonadaceae bacterium]
MANSNLYDDVHLLPNFRVKLDGSDLAKEIVDDVLEIVVEQSLHLPDACTIRLHDWDIERRQFRWVDDSRLKEGKKVEVEFGYQTSTAVVFKGEITAFEMDAAGHMVPNLIIHCVSKEHRLHRNRVRKTYQEVTDSDIVQAVGSRCGFSVDAEATSAVRHWVCQNNQTDYEFLKMIADRNGFRIWVDGDTLYFKKVKDPQGVDHEVDWGDNLRSFRPRLTTHGQVDEVSVHSWDMKTKQPILSTKTTTDGKQTAAIGEGKKGGQAAAAAFGGQAKHAIVDWPVDSQAEADSLAQSYLDKRETTFIEADGLCIGSTKIGAGKTLKVKGVGTRFSGKYFVTSATHTFTPAEGYTTQFVCSGKNPHTLLGMIAGEMSDQDNPGGYIVVAVVTDNLDPDNLGRIKVKYPWMMDEASFWARIASPMGGPGRGFYFLPEIDDEVLIAFEHGDIHRPFMIGALWNGVDKPIEGNDKAVTGGKVIHRMVKTRKGHILMLQDTDNEEHVKITTQGNHFMILDDKNGGKKVEIKTAGGHDVLIDDQNKKVEVKTTDGHYLLLDDQNKKIVMADNVGTEKVTIDAGSGDIKWECNGNFTIDAKQKVMIKGLTGVEINTPAEIKIDGKAGATVSTTAMLSLSGTAGAELKSPAILTVQGSLVKIN